jgi:hypothetical protein
MASGTKIVWPFPDLTNELRIDQGGQVSIGLGGSPSPVVCCQNFAGRGVLEHGVRRPPSLRQVGVQKPKVMRTARVRASRAAAGPGPGYMS